MNITILTDFKIKKHYEQRIIIMGRWWNRTAEGTYHISGKRRDMKWSPWATVPMLSTNANNIHSTSSCSTRWCLASQVWKLCKNQRDIACHASGDGHQERGREHHGPSHRVEDCRLSHQTGEPEQILLTLKRTSTRKKSRTEVTQSGYQQNFQDIAYRFLIARLTPTGWMSIDVWCTGNWNWAAPAAIWPRCSACKKKIPTSVSPNTSKPIIWTGWRPTEHGRHQSAQSDATSQ